MIDDQKITLIEDIKKLISVDQSSIDINPNYLEYFTIEELEDIKKELESKKQNQDSFTKDYVNELYDKFGI